MDDLWSWYLLIPLGFCHPYLLKLTVMKSFCAFLLLIENFNQINLHIIQMKINMTPSVKERWEVLLVSFLCGETIPSRMIV